MAQEVIRTDRVFKKFCCAPRRAMLYNAADICREFVAGPPREVKLRKEEFWAVQDVSFSLHRGESLAIIGTNGSGKSTMLNMLNGVLATDRGRLETRGRVGALTSIGAGFHPVLTGRENIAINALMLGMSQREIKDREEQIIDFADIGTFIDSPVQHYSSGMYVRLGFAIAAHSPVDILLIDELLSVGDLAFAIKCLRKIVEFRDQGGTVVLVTHSMHSVKFVCNHALWMEKGVVVQHGDALAVAGAYEECMLAKGEGPGQLLQYDTRAQLRAFNYPERIESGQPITIEAELDLSASVEKPLFCLHLHTSGGETLVFSHYSTDRGPQPPQIAGRQRLCMTTGPLHLQPGHYRISFSLSERELANYLFWHTRSYPLEIFGTQSGYGLYDAGVQFDLSSPA